MKNDDLSYINIIYDINKEQEDEINIFGPEFVENNKIKCKMIIDNKEYELTYIYNIKNYNNNQLNIKLKINGNVTNMYDMFYGCFLLSSLPDISNLNTNRVTNMNSMFRWCSSLSSLSDISNWNRILIMLLT